MEPVFKNLYLYLNVFLQVNTCLEIIRFILRKSEYSLAVIFVLIDKLLPKQNEEWAKSLTTELQKILTVKKSKQKVFL